MGKSERGAFPRLCDPLLLSQPLATGSRSWHPSWGDRHLLERCKQLHLTRGIRTPALALALPFPTCSLICTLTPTYAPLASRVSLSLLCKRDGAERLCHEWAEGQKANEGSSPGFEPAIVRVRLFSLSGLSPGLTEYRSPDSKVYYLRSSEGDPWGHPHRLQQGRCWATTSSLYLMRRLRLQEAPARGGDLRPHLGRPWGTVPGAGPSLPLCPASFPLSTWRTGP